MSTGEAKDPNDRYYFTVSAKLTSLEAHPGETRGPRGTRIHAIYASPAPVTTHLDRFQKAWQRAMPEGYADAKRFESLYADEAKPGGAESEASRHGKEGLAREKGEWKKRKWNGVEGQVLSGADFLLARPDGLLELDGRITIRANDETLIDAAYGGLIDLEAYGPGDLNKESPRATEAAISQAYLRFVEGKLDRQTLPLQLSIRFETNTGPWSTEDAEDSTWTKPSQVRHRGNVWKYAGLVRRLFSGFGSITFNMQRGQLPQPESIQFDVIELAQRTGE